MSWLEMKGTAKATIEPSRLMEWFNLIAGKRSTRAIDELVYCLCWELFWIVFQSRLLEQLEGDHESEQFECLQGARELLYWRLWKGVRREEAQPVAISDPGQLPISGLSRQGYQLSLRVLCHRIQIKQNAFECEQIEQAQQEHRSTTSAAEKLNTFSLDVYWPKGQSSVPSNLH